MHLTRYTIENLVTGTEKSFVTLTSREPLKFPNKEHNRLMKVFNDLPCPRRVTIQAFYSRLGKVLYL